MLILIVLYTKTKIKSIERWIKMFGYRSAIEMAVYTSKFCTAFNIAIYKLKITKTNSLTYYILDGRKNKV